MAITPQDLVFYIVHVCAVSAGVLYGVASLCFLRNLLKPRTVMKSKATKALVVASILHSVFIAEQIIELMLLSNSLTFIPSSAFSMSLVAWFLQIAYLLLRVRLPIENLGVITSPISMCLIILSSLWFHFENDPVVLEYHPLLLVHIAFSLLGHVFLVGAFSVSLALIIQEKFLKQKSFALVIRAFPPIRLLDYLNTVLLVAGVSVMGIGVILGLVFAYDNSSMELIYSARVLWSLLTLALYGALLFLILVLGYRGKRAAWGSVFGYLIVICSFFGSRLMGTVFHVH